MILLTVTILALSLQASSPRQQTKHSKDSVNPKVVHIGSLPPHPDTTGPGLNIIHAPLPEKPGDTMKKPLKLPVYKSKRHKPSERK